MFWGLIMEPKKRYMQTVETAFHLSKAALDIFNCDDEPTQIILTHSNRNYLLCTLQKDQNLQCSLNLNFDVGDQICFATVGNCNVHLSGYLVEQDEEVDDDQMSDEEETIVVTGKKRNRLQTIEPILKRSKTEQLLEEVDNYDSADDSTFIMEDTLDEENEDEDVDGEVDEDEDVDDEEDEEDSDAELDEEDSSLSESEEEIKAKPDVKTPVNGISLKPSEKKQKKKQKEIEQKQKEQQQNVNKTPKSEKIKVNNDSLELAQTPQKQKTLEGGVIIQDVKVGDGAIAKSGKMVQVYYEGRLKQNNKMFDSNKQGPGFKFKVGKQEVIKGWDVGLVGMKVGGKRRITCPPQMAYGHKGSPPVIPPNSTLVFEVELRKVL